MPGVNISPGWLDQWQLPKARESRLRGPLCEDQPQPTPSEFPDKPVDPTVSDIHKGVRRPRRGIWPFAPPTVHLKHGVTYDVSGNVVYSETIDHSDLPFESCPLCDRRPPPLCARPREAVAKNLPSLSVLPA